MLASAAAGSVLEIGDDVHFHFSGTFLFLSFLSSGRYPLRGCCFCPDAYGPDEAQQFTSNCGDDLPLVLAGCTQFHVALMHPSLSDHRP